ncbi:hypothetical protein CDD83_5400 [Cordyceps sp. RAO-2017]|nr:hypothetical protein CDD83_5400 [Cordyceps sp. RAO-2017]
MTSPPQPFPPTDGPPPYDSVSGRQFKITRDEIQDLDVMSPGDKHLFHVGVGIWGAEVPRFALYGGPDRDAPIVAYAYQPRFRKMRFIIGLGDPGDAHNLRQTLLRDRCFFHGCLRWRAKDAVSGATRTYQWEMAARQSDGTDPSRDPDPTPRELRLGLFDGETGAVVASFYPQDDFGRLRINVVYGREFDLMVLATFFCAYELLEESPFLSECDSSSSADSSEPDPDFVRTHLDSSSRSRRIHHHGSTFNYGCAGAAF